MPAPGHTYKYEAHHKHFFKTDTATRIPTKFSKGRFDVKLQFIPSPDHYKPRLSITNPKILQKSFGYRFFEKNDNPNPGPGTYNVRTKIKGSRPESELVKKGKKMRRKGKRKTKSRAATSRKSKGRKKFQPFANTSRGSSRGNPMRQTFTTFGSANKGSTMYKKSFTPGPGAYHVSFKKKGKKGSPATTRASTVKSTFGVDDKASFKKTKPNNELGPGHYEELDK